MTQDQWNAVDDYVRGLFAPPDAVLDEALRAAAAAGLPAINVSANEGTLLGLLARLVGAGRILEIGTLGGYSTIWLARSLAPGGRLVSLELDPAHADVARANLARAGLAGVAEVRVGAAQESLAQLAAEGGPPFDMVFIDADKPSYPDYLAWSLRLTRAGGLIVADNVVRGGAVADPAADDAGIQGVRRFNEMLAADPRVTATVIQTVGAKGYDGMALAVLNARG